MRYLIPGLILIILAWGSAASGRLLAQHADVPEQLVQYNRATSSWLTNIRYRFIYRPLSDFYVVYNDTRSAGRESQRTVAVKHTLMLAF